MSSNDINVESYRKILSQVDETITKFKNNILSQRDNSNNSLNPSSTNQIFQKKEKTFENSISELQLENLNLKYENHYLIKKNQSLEESLNKLKEEYETLKNESQSFSEKLKNINIIKDKNNVDQDIKYNNYINEIGQQYEILKRDNCLLVERQKSIDEFLHSKKELFTQMGIKINDNENEIIDISLFDQLLNYLIGYNQNISKDLEMYKNENKELYDRLEKALDENKELNEKMGKKKIEKTYKMRNYSKLFNEQNDNYENNYIMTTNNNNNNNINDNNNYINNQQNQSSLNKEENINEYTFNQKIPTPQIQKKNKNINPIMLNSPKYSQKPKNKQFSNLDDEIYQTSSYKSNIPIPTYNNSNGNKNNIGVNSSFYNQKKSRSFSNDTENKYKNNIYNYNRNNNINNNINNNNNNYSRNINNINTNYNIYRTNINNNKINNNISKFKGRNIPIKSEALEGLRSRIQKLDEMLKNANVSINQELNNDMIYYQNIN